MLAEQINLFNIYMNSVTRSISSSVNLSLSQFYTLQSISVDGISMTELSLLLSLDNSTLTRNINQLIKRKFVKKTQSLSDKRQFIISLSEEGRNINSKIDDIMIDVVNNIISTMDSNTRNIFVDILEKINWKLHCRINDN